MKQTFKEIIYWGIYYRLLKLSVQVFHFFPVKRNKIVMLHDFGLGYGDSQKYIAEEIKKQNLKCEIVWMVNDKNIYVPSFIRKTYLARIRSVYDFSTAKIVITTGKLRFNVKKKREQFFIYIPHGQIGAKYVERQAENTLSKSYIDNSIWHSKNSDLFMSSSKLHTEEMMKYYWYDGEIMEKGLPRNDIFFNYKSKDIIEIKKKLKIGEEEKIIIYAPTFRDNGNASAYEIDTKKILETLENKTSHKWRLLLRMHPNYIWFKKSLFHITENVIDVTNYPDMQELLLVSDMLISDYSSTMFDFMLMKRPVFLFTKDMEN